MRCPRPTRWSNCTARPRSTSGEVKFSHLASLLDQRQPGAKVQQNGPQLGQRSGVLAGQPGEAHGQHDVFQGREAAEEVEGLEDVADVFGPEAVALGLRHEGDVPVVDSHLAAVRPGDAGDDVQQRRLAAAALADQHHLLAGGDVELLDIEDRQGRAVGLGKRFFDVSQAAA